MKNFKRIILPVLLSAIWISISEFVRNDFFLKSYWTEHYSALGLVFPSEPMNGAVWGIWSLLFAIALYVISRKFTLWQTSFLGWFVGFILMWLVIWNMAVLPLKLLIFAIPLSFIEVFVASLILIKLGKGKQI